jgi:hypothetical protein
VDDVTLLSDFRSDDGVFGDLFEEEGSGVFDGVIGVLE